MSSKIKEFITNPALVFMTLGQRGVFNWMNDITYLKIAYRIKMGKKLNLDSPETLNEKLQWIKLYDHRPEYTQMVDKYNAKRYIAEHVGEQYVVPNLGVWDSFDDIDIDSLPDKFVLKCTHDSGGVVICTDKSKWDPKKAKTKINRCLKHNYYWGQREWAYKDVKPRIIAEKYMTDESENELKDYKIFCFNGRAEYVEVDFNRWVKHKLNPYDFDWNPLNFCDKSKNDYLANIPRPKHLEEMRTVAEKISQNYPFLRVDFYSIYDQLYIGELTLYPGSGYIQFNPPEVDLKYGKILNLGKKSNTAGNRNC